ncbi:MAG: hypothetical protein JXX28_18485 [Deltaproteobacteria bacterium]|nr:hypothetical protein [Deltaproteobacteria bacterium]
MNKQEQYRIVMPLGEQRQYVVYQVERLNRFGKIEAREALLLLRETAPDAIQRLRAQALALRNGSVSGLARMDRLVDFEGRTAVIRELLDGLSLDQALFGGPIPGDVSSAIIGKAASVLHQASSLPGADGRPLGLLHGSVQLSTLFVMDNGQVSVLDFGLVGTDPTDGFGRGRGAWCHVPPERWRGLHKRAGEVYSLGTVYYHLLTGRHFPEAGRTEDEHRALLASGIEGVSREYRDLLASMLDWSWRARPTLLEVRRQTKELVGGREGVLKAWTEANNALIRRKLPWPPPDEWSNRVIEVASPEVEVDEGGHQAWDDVTASYPIGALRMQGRALEDREAAGAPVSPPLVEESAVGGPLIAILSGLVIVLVVLVLLVAGVLLLFL